MGRVWVVPRLLPGFLSYAVQKKKQGTVCNSKLGRSLGTRPPVAVVQYA